MVEGGEGMIAGCAGCAWASAGAKLTAESEAREVSGETPTLSLGRPKGESNPGSEKWLARAPTTAPGAGALPGSGIVAAEGGTPSET